MELLSQPPPSGTEPLSRKPAATPGWNIAASTLWGLLVLALLIREIIHPGRATSLTTYLTGGSAWMDSRAIYTNWRGFVYPPPIAWFFSLFTHLPPAVAGVLWRLMSAGALYLGLVALFRSGLFRRIAPSARGIVFLGVLPLSMGNIDNAQANPLIAGLLLLSVAAFQSESWTLCALVVAVATAFKIYPLALGLLLCLLQPRRLSWRLALFLVLIGLLPFAFHSSGYVSGQYHAWYQTRAADDRSQYPLRDAPLDLWFLLVRLGSLPLSSFVCRALSLLAGAGLALFVLIQSRRRTESRDLLATLYLLVSVWMLLLGPASENQTYVILAPAVCLLAVELFTNPNSIAARVLVSLSIACLFIAISRNVFFPHVRTPALMALQPVAALLLIPAIFLCRGDPSGGSPSK